MFTDLSANSPSWVKHATHAAMSFVSAMAYAWRTNASFVMSFLSACWRRPAERGNEAGERSSPHPGDLERERRHARDHLIPASPAHHVELHHHGVATPPGWYTIRIRGRLGATALSAF